MMKEKKSGFTLIELVIVLAVLAIIALIAIPNFAKVREESEVKADSRSLDVIEKIVEFEIADGNIPDDSTVGLIRIKEIDGKVQLASSGVIMESEDRFNEAIKNVKPPQEKNKYIYQITVIQGEITDSKTVTGRI